MIIAKLMGGLGNQMFQYALGRRLAEQHGVELKVDLDFLLRESRVTPGTTVYEYGLPHFRLEVPAASPEEVARLRWPPARGLRRQLRKLRLAATPVSSWTHLQERAHGFDPRVLRAGPDAYLEGYWQSPHYFEAIADRIRADFQLKAPATGRNAGILGEIRGCRAAAVHVRRGDYVTSDTAARVHGVCGLDYYARALEHLARIAPVDRYVLFSDDPTWVAENLRVPGPAIHVGHNGAQPCEDIRLMSACTHFVIANSSFSWWGAWLADAPDKRVIAPRRWALDTNLDVPTRLPPSWIRL